MHKSVRLLRSLCFLLSMHSRLSRPFAVEKFRPLSSFAVLAVFAFKLPVCFFSEFETGLAGGANWVGIVRGVDADKAALGTDNFHGGFVVGRVGSSIEGHE